MQGTLLTMMGQGGAVCISWRSASAPEIFGTSAGAKGWGAAASSTMVPLGILRAIQGWRLQRLRSAWVRFSKFSAPQDKASPIALRISAGVWGGAICELGGGGTTITGAVLTSGAEARGTTGWMSRMGGASPLGKRLRSRIVSAGGLIASSRR